MSKAQFIYELGPPEVMQWEDWPLTDPAPGEGRVRHTAIGDGVLGANMNFGCSLKGTVKTHLDVESGTRLGATLLISRCWINGRWERRQVRRGEATTPEETLSYARRVLSRARREHYFAHGYVGVANILAEPRAVAGKYIERSGGATESVDTFDIRPDHMADSAKRRRLNSLRLAASNLS